MKKLLVLFTALAVTFAGIWMFKMKNPGKRPDPFENGVNANYWWYSTGEAQAEVDTSWRLSEGVPKNYIPVPGKTGLYMVVDGDGYIIGYKRLIKGDAGEITWEDVNPDIPENYEAVPNLKDVYKVTYDDGSVKYFKYIRNKDDTYAFVEVDAKGNMFGVSNPEGSEIPDNYERVNKNQFAVKNSDGVTIAFKERVVDPTSPSGFKWEDLDEDDVVNKTAASIANTGFNLDTDITGLGDATGGNRPYFEDIGTGGNTDITYSVPTLMPQQNVSASSQSGTFVFMQPTQETIITDQVYVTAPPLDIPEGTQVQILVPDGNGGGSNGVATQVIVQQTGTNGNEQGGSNEFINNMKDNIQSGNGNISGTIGDGTFVMPTMAPSQGDISGYTQTGSDGPYGIDHTTTGTIVSRETINTKVQEGNDMVTYQEIVEVTYDANGNELLKRSLGKKEVGRTSLTGAGGAQNTASNLNDEYGRVYGLLESNGGKFDAGVPARLRELINNSRIENGKQPLSAPGSNDGIYKIALSRAAMMALTGSSSKDLPTYGSLKSMCSTYGVSVNMASENMLITSDASAESINAMLSGSVNDIASSDGYSHVAIAVVKMNGKVYVCEIFY